MKTGLRTATIILTCVIAIASAGTFILYRNIFAPAAECPDFNLYVRTDATCSSVISEIADNCPGKRLERGLNLLIRTRGYTPKAGCYTIKQGQSAKDVYTTLSRGIQTPVKVTINSCRTIAQMAHQVSSQLMLDSVTVADALSDATGLDSIGYTPQNVFFLVVPDTYEFYWNVPLGKFMERMVTEHNRFWNNQRISKAESIGLTPLQVVTLASIVEEETSKKDEMPIVAGLYMNRLKKGMLLQADPTVIFALGGDRPKRVLQAHLKTDSPYNTYLYPGLPPSPIRFAGKTGIDAVLEYTRHNFLYMCAKEDFSGYHNFATNLTQHNINANKYRLALSAAGM